MSGIVGTAIILILALMVAWLINALPLQVMTKRLVMALFGAVVILWLMKVFVGFGRPFTWRP
jgi:hypothetical protein